MLSENRLIPIKQIYTKEIRRYTVILRGRKLRKSFLQLTVLVRLYLSRKIKRLDRIIDNIHPVSDFNQVIKEKSASEDGTNSTRVLEDKNKDCSQMF